MKRKSRGRFGCSKTQALKIHAKKRAPSRYSGVTLDNADLRLIAGKIQSGKGVFKAKRTNRVTEWEVTHKDVTWLVLYDKNRHHIITCLTP